MSEPTLRPIWTPDDVVDAALDAAQHPAYIGVADDSLPPAHAFPEVDGSRDLFRSCRCCGAWPDEQCEPGCLNLMTPEQARQYQNDVLDRTLAELDLLEASPPITQPTDWSCYRDDRGCMPLRQSGRHRAPAPVVGMRPGRAREIGQVLVAIAVTILVLTAGMFWILVVPQ